MFTRVYAIYTIFRLIPSWNIYFIGTQTLPDGPRLPPLPRAVLFFIVFPANAGISILT